MTFAISVIRFCRSLPKTMECDVIARQLLKAGTSVGANYRASCCGRSGGEWCAKLGIAREEADETNYWLTILTTLRIGPAAERRRLQGESAELTRLLSASIRTFKASKSSESS